MKRTLELCGVCIHLYREAGFKVTDHGRHEKIFCTRCGKRKWGAVCDVERIKIVPTSLDDED